MGELGCLAGSATTSLLTVVAVELSGCVSERGVFEDENALAPVTSVLGETLGGF